MADASRKVAALHASVEKAERQLKSAQSQTEGEVAELQRQIEAKRKALETRRSESETLKRACEAEADRLDDVLEFFSLDVAPSKYAAK